MLSEADGKVIIFGFSPLNPAISAQTVFDDQTVLSQKKISNFRLFYKLAAKETNIKIKLDCGKFDLILLSCEFFDFKKKFKHSVV